ncbi:MAG: hypothetical protein U1F29_14285 [Planctomycetota bacterium]
MLKPLRSLALLASLVVCVRSASAELRSVWQQTLTVGLDAPKSAPTAAGGILVGRSIAGPAPSLYSVELVEYDANGALLWTRAFALGGVYDFVNDLVEDPATGDVLLLVSSSAVVGPPAYDLNLLRLDTNGNVLWTATRATALNDQGQRVCLGANGAAYVVGAARGGGTFPYSLPFLFVVSNAGVVVNDVALPGSLPILDVAPYPGGGVVVLDTYSGVTQYEGSLLRFDAAGVQLWNVPRPVAAMRTPLRRRVAVDGAGRIVVAGASLTAPSTLKAWVGCHDANGNELWSRTFDDGTNEDQQVNDVALDAVGNVYAVACVDELAAPYSRGLVFSCDGTGAQRWMRVFGTAPGPKVQLFSIAVDAAGNSAAAGSEATNFVGPGLLLRHDADGVERGEFRTQAPVTAGQGVIAVFQTAPGDFVYAGQSADGSTGVAEVLAGRVHEQGVPFCFGDGSAAACPCANASGVLEQAGCRNSLGVAATLRDEGVASLAGDTLTLRTQRTNATSPTSFVQATQPLVGGAVFGDGLLCLGGTLVRLRTVAAAGGSASIGAGSTASISTLGVVTQPGVRHYQALYRNAASFCTPSTFNTTNGLEITWTL